MALDKDLDPADDVHRNIRWQAMGIPTMRSTHRQGAMVFVIRRGGFRSLAKWVGPRARAEGPVAWMVK